MFFVELLFKIIKKDLTDKKRQTFKEFLQFGLVGVSNTIISYLLYVVTLLLVSKSGVKFDYIIANIVSWLLSVLWSFYWNNKFVFKKEEGEERNIWAALFKTYVSYGFTGLILNNILSVLWVSVLHISKMLGAACAARRPARRTRRLRLYRRGPRQRQDKGRIRRHIL